LMLLVMRPPASTRADSRTKLSVPMVGSVPSMRLAR
jgi:hypothetical protein